jgi:hypothetical protein
VKLDKSGARVFLRAISKIRARSTFTEESRYDFSGEFDPGSGRTLAACLTHASRAECIDGILREEDDVLSGGWVSNAWATCLEDRDNSLKGMLIPDVVKYLHGYLIKGETRFEMGPRPIS